MTRASRIRRLSRTLLECFLARVTRDHDVSFILVWRKLYAARGQFGDDFTDLLQRLTPDPITGISADLRDRRLEPVLDPGVSSLVEAFGPEFRHLFETALQEVG